MTKTKRMVLAAMFIAVGLVLPFLTAQVPELGKMLLPMHIPVLLCGMICGWQYGTVVGPVTPLLRSVLFQAPTMYPTALNMAAELLAYGLLVGLIYGCFRKKNLWAVYLSLIPAMIGGRIIKGLAQMALLGVGGEGGFTLAAFLTGSFTGALPGIILQLLIVPAIMVLCKKAK